MLGENRFSNLSKNMNNMLMMLCKSEKLAKYLFYGSNNPLKEDRIPTISELLNSHIYPYPFTPETTGDAKSILNVNFDNFRLTRTNPEFKAGVVSFIILCHHSIWSVRGGLRPFLIMAEIDKMFNQQSVAGIGKLSFKEGNLVWANDKFSGYKVSYEIVDFN